MIQIDDIIKRSRYLNLSNKDQEYDKYHIKSKLLSESNVYRFNDKKFLLQHWESLDENQVECFKKCIDILDESYELDNKNDFNYIKNYIINEVTPTVRDAKQTIRYLKYKTTRMKNKINEKIKNNVEDIRDTTNNAKENIKNTASKSISILKNNAKKSLGQKEQLKEENIREAYIQILDVLEKYNHCDRILENTYNIQKRFNIMNMVESTDINNNAKLITLVDSICECINTYNEPFDVLFNTALETCFYFLSRKDKNFNKSLVLEEVVNNYLSNDISNDNLNKMRLLLNESVIFDNIDKECVNYLYKETPFLESSELAEPFDKFDDDNISKLKKMLSEVSDEMTDKDVRKIFSSIRYLFTVSGGEVLYTCINDIIDLIKNIASQYSGEDFGKLCAEELERVNSRRDNKSPEGMIAQSNYIKILNKYASQQSANEAELLTGINFYNEDLSSMVKTAKDIVNDFKLRKMKKATDVRTCVSKMFTKSPDQIIEGTPNLLSWVRLTYVIGATSINPILGGLTLLVDQFIAMKLKRRDVSKMITVFKNERKVVEEKMKKVDNKDKENLKAYDKYLKDGIDKLKEYEDSLLSEYEKAAKDSGEEYDRDAELKDIKGEDDDDDYDFSDDFELESTSFEKLFENSNFFSKEYFNNNISNSIDYMDEDTIDLVTEIACKYPCIVDRSYLYSILDEQLSEVKDKYSGSKKWIRMSCLNSNLKKLDSDYIITSNDDQSNVFDVINGLEDLFTELSINKTLNATNESMTTMAKSISDKLRKTMQKASDIDKEASRKIDSAVNMFISGMQRAARNNNREAIIRGSIIPSASKVIKAAIIDGGAALINPALGIILAVGQFAISKKMQKKERQLVLDEIEVELEMCKRYLRQAEDQNDLEAQKRILQIQRNLERQHQRITYNMKVHWNQNVPDIKKSDD